MEVHDNGKHVRLVGAMTIECALEAKSLLLELLANRDYLSLNIEEVSEADLSCLQLLCALHKSAMQAGKIVTLNYSRASVITEILLQAGCVRHTGCAGNEKCFWSEASHE
ncbi:MAG: STAS domain-containing protein [Proteobacteria bacterium]|nr:STAS domain-containing protein [Pseudomonadota bacterium]